MTVHSSAELYWRYFYFAFVYCMVSWCHLAWLSVFTSVTYWGILVTAYFHAAVVVYLPDSETHHWFEFVMAVVLLAWHKTYPACQLTLVGGVDLVDWWGDLLSFNKDSSVLTSTALQLSSHVPYLSYCYLSCYAEMTQPSHFSWHDQEYNLTTALMTMKGKERVIAVTTLCMFCWMSRHAVVLLHTPSH